VFAQVQADVRGLRKNKIGINAVQILEDTKGIFSSGNRRAEEDVEKGLGW
jgi:hypothetical protein